MKKATRPIEIRNDEEIVRINRVRVFDFG